MLTGGPAIVSNPLAGAAAKSGGAGGEGDFSAQLARVEAAHRAGVAASPPPSPPSLPAQAPPPPFDDQYAAGGIGAAAAGIASAATLAPGDSSARAPSSLLPPRTRSLLDAALTSGADADALPVQRVACTARVWQPCARLNGNVATFYRCKRESRLFPAVCFWGPDWPCNLCTFLLILGPSVPFQALIAWRIHIGVSLAGIAAALFSLAMLALTALSDPGYLPKQSKAQMEAQRQRMEEQGQAGTFTVCQFCNVIRVQRTSHCYDCNACVVELDHHCPWMGQCIGKNTLMYFYGFLWSIVILLVFTAGSFFAWLVNKQEYTRT